MSGRKFGVDIELDNNQLKGAVLEHVSNAVPPLPFVEGRIGYHTLRKLPVFHNGFGLSYLVTEDAISTLLGGLAWKDEVLVADGDGISLAALIPTYELDGEVLEEGDRVLLVGQTDASENGIWVVGTPSVRSGDMDDSSDFNTAVVPVRTGTFGGWMFRCTNINPDVDVDSILFVDMTPSVPNATTGVPGKARLATQAEVTAGIVGDAIVTPATLKTLLDPMRTQLGTLIPPPPNGLAGRSIVMSLYTALEEGSGDSHACTDNLKPVGSVSGFYDGNAGVLTAEIDTVVSGTRSLTSGSDIGSYDALNITNDYDPIPPGQPGAGLYKQLDANVQSELDLDLGVHSYRLKHSLTGDSALKEFWIDNPDAVTVSGVSVNLPTTTRMVSGVPSLSVGDSLLVSFTVDDAVKKHYNGTRLARLQSSWTQSRNIAPPVTPPVEEASVGYTNEVIQVLTNVYTEDLVVSVLGYNSKDVAGVTHNENTGARVDTKSMEQRKEAGGGLYPTTGYGGAYDSAQSLKDYYTEELQLLDGKYQRPNGNYSGNLPTGGPDYTTGMGSDIRWVLFDMGVLSAASSFVITLNDTEGTWSGVETSGLYVQVKVEGATEWLDANKAFSLVGAPVNNGDACMVFGDSTESTKKVSFGNTPRSGLLLIRIGLPSGSDKKFGQDVMVNNIV